MFKGLFRYKCIEMNKLNEGVPPSNNEELKEQISHMYSQQEMDERSCEIIKLEESNYAYIQLLKSLEEGEHLCGLVAIDKLKEEHKIMRKMLGATHWKNIMKMEEVLSEEETDVWNKLMLIKNSFTLNQ